MRPSKIPLHSIVLQDRDIALLRALFESRIMTAAHIAAIHFNGHREYGKKRLQKLKAADLIGERKRRVNEPAILFLSRRGLGLLKEHGILLHYPPLDLPALERRSRVSELTIRHELAVMDVKAAFHTAARQTGTLSIVDFCTWPALHEFTARYGRGEDLTVKPDGFIRIHENEPDGGLSEHIFFLEVDRSTETLDTLASRASGYLHYYRSGGFAVRNGAPCSAFKEYPFRVLMVFKTVERRNNMAERLLQNNPPILTQVYLSTSEEVAGNPFDAVWIRPMNYRIAVSGTPHDLKHERSNFHYERRTVRDLFIETAVVKLGIFE